MVGEAFGGAEISSKRNGRFEYWSFKNHSHIQSMQKLLFRCSIKTRFNINNFPILIRLFWAIILSIITIRSWTKRLHGHTAIIVPESFGVLCRPLMCVSIVISVFTINALKVLCGCVPMWSHRNVKNRLMKSAPKMVYPFKHINVPNAIHHWALVSVGFDWFCLISKSAT